jgi:UPF0755 protein
MRRLGTVLVLFVAAAAAFAGWANFEMSYTYKGYAAPSETVDIPHGTSRSGIASLLEKEGVIRNHLAFEVYERLHERQPLQAGEYLFDRPLTPRDIFWMIARGRVYVHTVTVPEGWTMFDIAGALEREGLSRREEFLAAAHDASLVRDIAPQARNLEGFLFPASYEFTKHATAEQIAAAMVARFRTVWDTLPHQGTAGGGTLGTVALASLVERETPVAAERPLVAGVFYNRLRRGMPLQCDPTVQYALELAGRPTPSLSAADLRISSPYNTYLHAGLPPGPIANPGEASLRAALDPAATDDLYFVANTHGGHFFSKTLAEHNRNVTRYRRLLNGEDGAPPKPEPKKRHRSPH